MWTFWVFDSISEVFFLQGEYVHVCKNVRRRLKILCTCVDYPTILPHMWTLSYPSGWPYSKQPTRICGIPQIHNLLNPQILHVPKQGGVQPSKSKSNVSYPGHLNVSAESSINVRWLTMSVWKGQRTELWTPHPLSSIQAGRGQKRASYANQAILQIFHLLHRDWQGGKKETIAGRVKSVWKKRLDDGRTPPGRVCRAKRASYAKQPCCSCSQRR